MSRESKSRFLFWKKRTQRSFKKLLRPLVFEGLESRQLFDATNWTNPFQRLDVSGGVSQSVDPLDALFLVNEINSPFYASPSNGKLPDLPASSNRDSRPYLDVDCDGYVSALDVLSVVNAINQGFHPAGWKPEFNTSQGLDGGFVSSASCGPKLHEGASYVTQISTEVTIPPNATNLSFRLTLPSFDTTSPTGMKDAFEAALVDQNGNALVFPYSRSRDSFLNMTEGQVPVTAPGVKVSGDKVDVNVSQIPAGTTAKLVIRLVNNDRDTLSNAGVSELRIATDGIGVPIGSASPESASFTDRRNEIDFSHFSDVTGSLVAKYGRTSHFDDPQVLYSDLAIHNNGSYLTKTPLLLVLKNFSDLSVRVRNADGLTPDGDPYFDFSTLVADGVLSPSETTASRNVTFYNPNQTQFTYEIAVLSELNSAPLFISEPDVEALVGKVYTHVAAASDLDGDKLSFSILSGPAGMTVDSVSGTVTWQPNTSHLGNHSIILRVDDGHGGTAQQTFTLAVTDTPPNRPPVFTSRPIVDSNFGQPYVYDAKARDDDGDALAFSLVSGPQTMQVNAESGRVTWTPTSDKLVYDAAKDFSATVNPGNPWSYGWTASQGSAFNAYPRAFKNSGLDAWDDANQFVAGAPVVTHNGTSGTILTSNNIQWAPGQLSFHPGPSGQRSVVRWTAPVGGDIRIDAEFGNLDLNRAATTDVHVLHNNVSIFDGIVQQNNKVKLAPVQRQVKVGDTIDFVVGEGADSWTFDTTSLAANIVVERQTSVAATLMAQDGRGGSATQNVVIDIQPAVGNHAPIFVSEPITEAFVIDPSTVGTPVDLSKWSVVQYPVGGQGPAEWVLEQNNSVARQRKNADPSILVSDFNFSNDQVRGGFRADLPVADDDFMGFVFGYQDPQHYYLFDWKKATQSNGESGLAQVGMSVKIVDADAPLTVRDLWNTDTKGAQVRTIYHNSIPWEFGVDYDFSLEFHPGHFTIIVSRGATKLAEIQMQDSTYTTGKFGFYNFSQGPVSYSGFRHQIAPSYGYEAIALDADNDALTYSLDAGPPRMTIDSQTGKLTWTPTDADVGEHLVSVRVKDGRGSSDVQRFVVHTRASSGTPAEIRGTKFHDLNGDGVRGRTDQTVNASVPGYSDPWLAGMPNGSTASSGDIAPAHSPTQVAELNLIPGTALTFQATGSVNFIPAPSGTNPDGDRNNFLAHTDGAQNGIANIIAPMVSLVAIFLGPDQPNLTPAPTSLDFQSTGNVAGGLDYLTLSPQLKQVFFVGDGLTSNGQQQQIIVPEGATRLFLGTMDSYGWHDNFGAFAVKVTAVKPEPGLRNWTIYLDQNTNGVLDSNEPSTLTNTKGEYTFTNLNPGTYVVAEVPYPTYDAVQDFTSTENPNSPWTYGYSQTRGSTFQQSTISGVTTTLDYWSATTSGPHVTHNLTGSTIPGGITYPPDALNLDPSFDGRNAVLRFTAPVTDTYRVTGRFQGIDLTRGSTTDVAILQNSNSILNGNINGFFRDLATTPGAIVPYDLQVTLQQGETLDFSVGQGTGGSLFDSTGVSAIIVGSNWRQTSPATKTHSILVGNGEIRSQVDFGNLEQASVPSTNRSPKITSTAVTESGVGARYRATATATDVDHDRLTFDLPVKPSGMTVDPSTGIIIWTPTADQAGVQNVILRVSDGRGGVDLQSFQVNVASRNSGPTITSRPLGPARANLPYQYRIRAQDAEGDAIEYSLNTPAIGNMTVDSVTGVFSWLPSSSNIGSHTIEVTATDSSGDGQLQKFTLEVLASGPNREPRILSTPREQVRLGSSYMYAIDGIDPDGDPLAYRLDVAPDGMAIDLNGLITWTPTASQFGNNPVQVSVSDGLGGVRIQAFTIAVLSKAENHAPIINSTPTLAATLGLRYRYDVKATDEDGDTLAFSLDTKPTGMSIDALTGAIRWIPTADQLGAQPIVVRVTDPQGASATQSLTVTVRGSNLAPEISSLPKTIAAVGRAYSYVLKATDPEGGPLTYSLSKKSGNMIIDSTGAIQWVPGAGEVGNVNVTVRVSDDQGASVEQSFTVVVAAAAPNAPPIITSQPNLGATVGQRYQYQVTATDPEGGAVRFAFLEVPNGMTIDESTGLIQWTSDAAGIGRVTVLVGDFDGGEAEQSFEVTVRSSNVAPQITSTPVVTTAASVTYRYDVRANDPNFDPLTFALVTGPVGMTMDNLGRITWSTAIADAGTHRVKFTVSDDRGASASQEYDLVVTADTEAPKVRIQVDSNPVGLNETLIIQVNASDNTGVKALDVTVDGKAISLDARGRASVLMTQVGTIRIAAVATDAAGNAGRQTMDVKVVDTSVTGAPTVDVTIPAENATITAPTDVIGTIQDPNLVSWKLEVSPFDGGEFKQIAIGTNQITNGKIATFDPTLLQNDSYILRLTALNTGGLSSSIDTTVNVAGNLKLGNFTLSFTDLSIPVAGIPITVSRTYDTLNANQDGELGYGWKLAFRDVDLRTSLPKTGDEAGGIYTPFRDGTRVYVTLPGGQREGYTFRPKAVALFDQNQRERDVGPETQSGNGINMLYFVPSFVPDKGVTNKLSVPRFQLTKQGHEYFQFGGGLPYNPTDPAFGGRFTLSHQNGMRALIDGLAGKLISISSPDGSALTFSEDSIVSSLGTKVSFEREPSGRIVSVVGPDNKKVRYDRDINGDLTTVVDIDGNSTRFQYRTDRPHYLDRVIDPLNRQAIRSTYNEEGRIVGVTGADGNSNTIAYDSRTYTETVTDARGGITVFQKDDFGNEIVRIDPLGNRFTNTYDANGNVLTTTDALGRTTSFTYNDEGNLLTEVSPYGGVVRRTYDAAGNPLTETDPFGNTTTKAFNTRNQLLQSIDANGGVTQFEYSSGSEPTKIIDAMGKATELTYDRGFLTAHTDELGHKSLFTVNSSGQQIGTSTFVTTPSGQIPVSTSSIFSAGGTLQSYTNPNGGTTLFERDATGQISSETNPLGRRSDYTRDVLGRATRMMLSGGVGSSVTFDAMGLVASQIDAAGRITRYEYDANGRQVSVISPDDTPDIADNPRTWAEYDAIGRITANIDSNGNRTETRYDDANRQIVTRNPLGQEMIVKFDLAGRTESEIDALGRKTRHDYDALGRIVKTTFADGSTRTKSYSALADSNAVTETDELGRTLRNSYDASGRLVRVTSPLGFITQYTYDELGRRIAETDAEGRTTHYEYNASGQRIAIVLPGGQRATTKYDLSGAVVESVAFDNSRITQEYNEFGRLSVKRFPNDSEVTYSYTTSGRIASTTSVDGTTRYSYDALDRLLMRTQPDGEVIRYEYDRVGNRTALSTRAGITRYTYDSSNRLVTVTDPGGLVTRYSYDAANNLTSTQFPNSTTETRLYDLRNRVIRITLTNSSNVSLTDFVYRYDAAGQVTHVDELGPAESVYKYDLDGRLVSEVITDNSGNKREILHQYDNVGNRVERRDSEIGTTVFTYDSNDRLMTETTGGAVTRYVYDANGSTLSRDAGASDKTNYVYDVEGRLISATITKNEGSHIQTYGYDIDGNRVSTVTDGIETRYLLDTYAGPSRVALEYRTSGLIVASFVWGLELVSANRGVNIEYYGHDRMGSTRLLTDAGGTPVAHYSFDAYGRILLQDGASSNAFMYKGEARDVETGLDYLRARYYNPSTGRFMTRDSHDGDAQFPLSRNHYLYALSSPTQYTDPTGHFPLYLALKVTVLAGLVYKAYRTFFPTRAMANVTDHFKVAKDEIVANLYRPENVAKSYVPWFQKGPEDGVTASEPDVTGQKIVNENWKLVWNKMSIDASRDEGKKYPGIVPIRFFEDWSRRDLVEIPRINGSMFRNGVVYVGRAYKFAGSTGFNSKPGAVLAGYLYYTYKTELHTDIYRGKDDPGPNWYTLLDTNIDQAIGRRGMKGNIANYVRQGESMRM